MQVVVRRCRALTLVFPCPNWGMNKFDWFSRGFNFRELMDANANKHRGCLFTCAYEWRLNMEIGEVQESNLMGTEFSMDFPFINAILTGLLNKCGYTQVINSKSSSKWGMAKYGNLVKLYFDEPCPWLFDSEVLAKVFQVILIIHCTCRNVPYCGLELERKMSQEVDEGLVP
ncbi:uncharacterized protein LOC130135582 [Syzygium oleosum]|uniref:uncharacterized protein LOC130135582 n=1 Tax=Syzygium oleosum TaxID=219896 RepID=UPI0024BB637F|nr:uncharacterized protein LOC130135582 [Syzygium oleosum]